MPRYTLHEAITRVLSEVWPSGLSAPEITRIIWDRGWYRQRDGTPLTPQQTYARIRNYEHLFDMDRSTSPATIRLRKDPVLSVDQARRPPPGNPLRTPESISTGGARSGQAFPIGVGNETRRPPSGEWFWEGNIQRRIGDWLQADGWTIRSAADTAARKRGIDLIAVRGKRTLLVEVKGYPSRRYVRGPKAGEAKPTPPGLQARHWFAEALLSALLRQDEMPRAQLALGFPDKSRYRDLLEKTQSALRALGVRIFLVSEDGIVREGLPPQGGEA